MPTMELYEDSTDCILACLYRMGGSMTIRELKIRSTLKAGEVESALRTLQAEGWIEIAPAQLPSKQRVQVIR